jgi:hypothetical protein
MIILTGACRLGCMYMISSTCVFLYKSDRRSTTVNVIRFWTDSISLDTCCSIWFLGHMKQFMSIDNFPRQVHKKPIMNNVIQGSHCVPGMVGVTPLKHTTLIDSRWNSLWASLMPNKVTGNSFLLHSNVESMWNTQVSKQQDADYDTDNNALEDMLMMKGNSLLPPSKINSVKKQKVKLKKLLGKWNIVLK